MNTNLCLILSTLTLILTCIRLSNARFTGMFVFGDSIMDNGNNNFLLSRVKANKSPYGIDFPLGPSSTGRFTNGKNPADLIGDLLGLPLIPSFSNPQTKGSRVSRGVNHASAGSGILDSTASSMGVNSLNRQIRDFLEVTSPMLRTEQGCPRYNIVKPYLFLISTGSNDFLLNFFKGGYNIASLEHFSNNLTSTLEAQVILLYNAGVKKIAFIGMGPIGCTPMVRATMPSKVCNETMNYAAYYFNTQLLAMLEKIQQREAAQLQFVVLNLFQITLQYIQNPSFGGFTDVNNSCCEVSLASDVGICKQGGNVCTNRKGYMFFDGQHPTEAFYSIVAARGFNSTDKSEVSPYNIQRLEQI